MSPSPVTLRIAGAITSSVRLAHVSAAPVRIEPAGPALRACIESTCAELRGRYAGRTPAEIDGLRWARSLYRAFGMDPTKTRPSSEALLRRVLKEKPFPDVSNAVDLCNLCAVRSLLPLGLYDVDKIEGAVEFRRGKPGESYAGIRKGDVRVEDRPTFADDRGAFGNPTSDSLRTSVDAATTRVWMVFIAPADFPGGALGEHLEQAARDMAAYVGDEGVDVSVAMSGGKAAE